MNTIYKKYVDKYGNFLYILTIDIVESLSQDDKNIILYDIYNFINDKYIKKHISNTDISIKWRVYDNTDLLHYYTDANAILSDKGIYEHTKLLLNDFKKINNSDKFKIHITKPLTKSISIM
jgi:hypothetical protein